MNIPIAQKDILKQALESLRVKYAGYRICSIAEFWSDEIREELIENGVWYGYYENPRSGGSSHFRSSLAITMGQTG